MDLSTSLPQTPSLEPVSKRAVIIGVNQYNDPDIKPLAGCENDARELYSRLVKTDKNPDGFRINGEHFLWGEKATSQAIRQAISDLFWDPEPCGLSLFYFSGHGFRDNYGNGYLAPCDIQKKAPFVCGIRMQELTDLLQKTVLKDRILVILDCCYSGIAATGTKDGAASDSPDYERWFEGINNSDTGQGKLIFASSGKDRTSSEVCLDPAVPGSLAHFGDKAPTRHYHGAFSFRLLEGLDGKAAKERNDFVTAGDLWDFLYREMKENPPKIGGLGFGTLEEQKKFYIAKATLWRSIEDNLERAEGLTQGRPRSVFRAVDIYAQVAADCPNLERAKDLKKQIDDRLKECRGRASTWLTMNSSSLDPQLDRLVDDLGRLARQLAVEKILQYPGSADEKKLMRGLVMNLCEVSTKRPDSDETYITTDDFIAALDAAWSESRQGTSGVAAKQSAAAAGIPMTGRPPSLGG